MSGFFRRYGTTLGLLAFLAFFYTASAARHHAVHGTHPADAGAPAGAHSPAHAPRMTPDEIKGREDRFKKSMETDPAAFGFVASVVLLLIVSGLAADAALGYRRLTGKTVLAHEADHRPVGWGVLAVANLFLVLLAVEAVLLTAESFIFPGRAGGADADLLLMANSLIRDILVGAFIVWLVVRRYGTPMAEIGLTGRDFARNVRRGLVAYLAAVPPLIVIITAVLLIAGLFSYQPPPQPVVEIYLRQKAHGAVIFFTVFVAVVGPVLEELFFRGFAYKALRTRFGASAAAVLSAGFFAMLHANLVALVPIFCLGLFLAYLYERTGSLVPGITAHMTHNLIMVALTLFFKTHSGGA